jgi:hypothetical protein
MSPAFTLTMKYLHNTFQNFSRQLFKGFHTGHYNQFNISTKYIFMDHKSKTQSFVEV